MNSNLHINWVTCTRFTKIQISPLEIAFSLHTVCLGRLFGTCLFTPFCIFLIGARCYKKCFLQQSIWWNFILNIALVVLDLQKHLNQFSRSSKTLSNLKEIRRWTQPCLLQDKVYEYIDFLLCSSVVQELLSKPINCLVKMFNLLWLTDLVLFHIMPPSSCKSMSLTRLGHWDHRSHSNISEEDAYHNQPLEA